LVALCAVAFALVALAFFRKTPSPSAKPVAVAVSEAIVMAQDFPVSITALGAAQAWTSDTILAQVSGILLSVDFIEGTDVKAGQVLAQVDPTPYQAVLTLAKGRSDGTRHCSPAHASISSAMPRWSGRTRSPNRNLPTSRPG
jgi:membrane fusion protein, multidrug efflux system